MNRFTVFAAGLAAGAVGMMILPGLLDGREQGARNMGCAPYENLSPDRQNIWPADMPAPTLDLDLIPDINAGHNLVLNTTNFTMTPEDLNAAAVPGTGHGHLFVNGENRGRIYANMMHLTDLPKGEVTLHVYIGGNDHKVWMVDGQPYFAEETFTVE